MVGSFEHVRGNGQADQLRGPEVGDDLELGRRLDGHVGGLFALEDAIDVARRPAVLVDRIGGIRDQAPFGDEKPAEVDRGQLMPRRERNEAVPAERRKQVWRHDQAAARTGGECRQRALQLGAVARVDQEHLPESLRGTFGRAVPGVEHKIIHPDDGRTLGPGESGEICVRGYSLMQGLYKVERQDVFDADGFYHTADAGYFDADGWLFF